MKLRTEKQRNNGLSPNPQKTLSFSNLRHLTLSSLKICKRTKVLKKMEQCLPVYLFHSSTPTDETYPNTSGLENMMKLSTITCIILSQTINLAISEVSSFSLREQGRIFRSFVCGFSRMREIDPKRSMTRLIHSNCKGWRGLYPTKTAPSKAITAATRFMVSWRVRNFFTVFTVCLPHLIVAIMELNLSSRMTISEASLAVSLQVRPIAMLTSALRRASVSLVPLPATATMFPHYLRPTAKRSLSSASARQMIFNVSLIILKFSKASFFSRPFLSSLISPETSSLKSQPSMMVQSMEFYTHYSGNIPVALAAPIALFLFQFESILTVIPYFSHSCTVFLTPSRMRSLMPTMDMSTKFFSTWLHLLGMPLISLQAIIMIFWLALEKCSIAIQILCLADWLISSTFSQRLMWKRQQERSSLGEPLMKRKTLPFSSLQTVAIFFLGAEEVQIRFSFEFMRNLSQLQPIRYDISRRALSVLLPICQIFRVFPSDSINLGEAVVFIMMARLRSLHVLSDIISRETILTILSQMYIQATDRRFFETKPVLDRQRLSTLPMVSQSLRCFTKILHFSSYFAVLDRAMVTSRGRLYGRATSMVKVIRMAFTSS